MTLNDVGRSFYSHQARIAHQVPRIITQTGKALVHIPLNFTSAEATFEVKFVNLFSDEPTFTTGAALDLNQSAVAGYFPTASGLVTSWKFYVPPGLNPSTARVAAANYLVSYYGAVVAFVVTGSPGQNIWCHYSFIGTGLLFPANANPSNGTGTA